MNDARQAAGPAVPPSLRRARHFAFAPGVCQLVGLLLMLGAPLSGRAADPYAAVLDNYFAPEEGPYHHVQPEPELTPAQAKVVEFEAALKAQTRELAEGPPAPPPPPKPPPYRGFLGLAALFLGGGLGLWRLALVCNRRFNPWALSVDALADSASKLRTEEAAFSRFVQVFQTGPAARAGQPPSPADAVESEPVREFLAKTPAALRALQKAMQKIIATNGETARAAALRDFQRELHHLKGAAGLPELLPFWQLTTAVEGLVQQLTDKVANISPSTLRTVAGGLDMLRTICVPGLPADLLTQPPLRLLAVDDDLISRRAVSIALKKALTRPDLAENGMAALALATEHTYDAIFLDVQMPGMDGFETCTKIHETVPNAKTPVVFVTCMGDFDARAKSVLSGGNELISKPFLTFEITVKALTLTLQGRLHAHAQTVAAGQLADGNSAGDAVMRSAHAATRASTASFDPRAAGDENHAAEPLHDHLLNGDAVLTEPTPQDLTRAFLARASAQLGPLRGQIQTVFQATDDPQREELLADFYLRFNGFMPGDDIAKDHPVRRLSEGVQGLLKKLLQSPQQLTSSSLLSIAAALDLLPELCAKRVKADLATNPPVRILAVDDDPIARRALLCALQMTFGKPDCADSGEAALELAKQKAYDVIFMDVNMPGMDGFTTCFRVHETELNHDTPVVFVTNNSDYKARSQASVSGGSDFMSKPFLTAEISLKALTFALRSRLRHEKTAANVTLLAKEEEPVSESAALVPA